MTTSIKALLVEDDGRLARFTTEYLREHDVEVVHVADGDAAIGEAQRTRYDVVLLDVMLPGKDGVTVCRKIRERSDVPIIMITARVAEGDRVTGLDAGADDYLAKPFSSRELLARVHAVVRRDRGELGKRAGEIKVGALVVVPSSRAASLDGRPSSLTTAEFDLLLVFAERPGRVLSREQLLELAKGSADQAFDRAIDVTISRLRQKLAAFDGGADLIRTVRGAGYLLAEKTA